MLSARGFQLKRQTAVGTYNCDFSFDSVAVEIWGGTWHFQKRKLARNKARFRKFFDAGFSVIVFPFFNQHILSDAVADYAVALFEELRRNPPSVCEYRMVWGAGEHVARCRFDADDFPTEWPFTNRRDPATGRYYSVPK